MTIPAGGRGLVRGLGPFAMVALVAGNIIGSGIFVVPGTLARDAGPIALVAWVGVAIAYALFIPIFADLVRAWPEEGGLQVYAQRAFGDLAGLQTAFLYWLSVVIGNAAFVTAFVGYFQVFFPAFSDPLRAFLLAQGLLWALTLVNVLGVRAGGAVATTATIMKLVPLVVLVIVLFGSASTENLVPFAPHGAGALLPAVSIIAWLFVGAESATVPAEEVKGAGVTVSRAVYAGYAVAAGVYLAVAFALNLGVPSSLIAGSASPLAAAAGALMGPWGSTFVTIGALVSIAGILNGWLLVAGRLPFAAARQGFAPLWLGRLHPTRATPVAALLLSSAVSGALLFSFFSQKLLDAYNFVALASTATSLVAIGFACASFFPLSRREPGRLSPVRRRWGPANAAAALVIIVAMIAGSGWLVIGTTLALIVIPVPVYFVFRRMRRLA